MAAPRKVLFIMPSLDAGGGEKSLVSLLDSLDPERVNVSLLLLHKRGIFLPALPDNVRVAGAGNDIGIFSRGLASSLISFISRGKFTLALHRFLFFLVHRKTANRDLAEQRGWKYLSAAIPKVTGSFDAVVGFMEKTSVYAAVDKTDAPVKIGWIHTNYENTGMDPAFDRPYFSKLSHLVAVSESCKMSLVSFFPELADRISVVRNIISPELIVKLASMPVPDKKAKISIVSVGRLSREKGFDMAVEAAALLVEKNLDFMWQVIGDGPERKTLEAAIAARGLQKKFILSGLNPNPYPQVSRCDIYVQPSRHEGRSIALDEAMALRRPIVVTGFSTVADQIEDGRTGIVAPISAEGLAAAILRLANDPELRAKLSENLRSENVSTASEILKFYALIPA